MIDNLKTGDTVQLAVKPTDSSGPSELYRREPSIGVPFVQMSIDRHPTELPIQKSPYL
jgi:hypothetical protein